MRYPALLEVLKRIYSPRNGHAAMLLGPPGIGKTAIWSDLAKALGWDMLQPRHVVFEEVIDSRGMPATLTRPDGSQRMTWLPPDDLPLEDNLDLERDTLCLLDDLTQAIPQVQNGYARWFYPTERVSANGRKLHPKIHVGATGNRVQDRAAAYELPSFLAMRTTILTLDPHPDDWFNGFAIKNNNVHVHFASFICGKKFGSHHLCDFDPNRQSNCSPRTLETASTHYQSMENEEESILLELFKGILCPSFGPEFLVHRKLYATLPDVGKILEGDEAAISKAVSASQDIKYLVTLVLAKEAEEKHIDALVEFIMAFPRVVDSAFALQMFSSKVPGIRQHPEFIKWISQPKVIDNLKCVT